jgi:hypothetical protein
MQAQMRDMGWVEGSSGRILVGIGNDNHTIQINGSPEQYLIHADR